MTPVMAFLITMLHFKSNNSKTELYDAHNSKLLGKYWTETHQVAINEVTELFEHLTAQNTRIWLHTCIHCQYLSGVV
jgi:hypothetical protein